MKKRALTLLEIMIVIFLITLITGTIGYSMRGTLDKGRAFRTEQAKTQLRDLLLICLAEEGNPDEIAKNPAKHLKQLGLAKDPDGLLKDGWKKEFEIRLIANKTDFKVESEALKRYYAKQKKEGDRADVETEEE
jgi:hypothetical protein